MTTQMKMNTQAKRRRTKRLGAMAVAGSMLLHTVGPAYAVVSQLPGLYITPPDANVMFTLDDSLSMLSDAIPDFIADKVDMPTDDASAALAGFGARFPGMWGAGSGYLHTDYYRQVNPTNPGRSKVAAYLRSSAGNPLYYNPNILYSPWPTAADDKLAQPNANPAAVNIHGTNPLNTGRQIDLRTRVNLSGGAGELDDESKNFWPATYYVYTGVLDLAEASPSLTNPAQFTKVEIKPAQTTYARDKNRSGCTGAVGVGGCSYAEELQNFANWLQYYRSRMLMAKGGVAGAFAKQLENLRVGFGTINSPGTVRQGVAKFDATQRTNFYTDLYSIPGNPAGTPLRRAADDVGKYFQRSNVGNPWAEDPNSNAVGKEYTCRKAFHLLATDGYWNDGSGEATAPANANNDSFSGVTPATGKGKTYAFSDTGFDKTDALVGRFTINPFLDGAAVHSNTLADVTAYYWKTDLRSDLSNDVFPSTTDPAFWQHLTTYTFGLGISGSGGVKTTGGADVDLSSKTVRTSLIANKTALTWTEPNGAANDNNKGDDLIHAAMNGRGDYVLASDQKALKSGLSAALAEATNNPGSSANIATSSRQLSAANQVYQATFTPDQWYGRLYAFSQSASGVVSATPSDAVWEASNKMPAPTDRNIYSWNPVTKAGSLFTWTAGTGLTTTQKGNLSDDSTLLDYLRGSAANELAQGGTFRDRSRYSVTDKTSGVTVKGGVLGDIVNGSPVKGPSFGAGYQKLPAGSAGQDSYAAYRLAGNSALNNMRDTIFTGANDGMLHAFNRLDGVERFAFVPNSVFNVPRSPTTAELKLKLLSDPGYTHRFTVDGPPQIGDAYIAMGADGPSWKTVLVSSTGAGARSVFAMDVSNPAVGVGAGDFSQTKLLWEFSEADNVDMGYVIGYPHIARMRDGTWVSIFGNGYDSTNGQAKLFIMNLQTGAVLWERSVGAAGGNGLSQPNFTLNSNREVTAIYAGDLKGKLWKFDVDSDVQANWKVAFAGAAMFDNSSDGKQPITVMPEITFHPNGGTLVAFGTGKLFETEDTVTGGTNVNLNPQAIYSIWDKPGELTGFSGNTLLVQQTMNGALAAAADVTARLTGTTSNTVDWSTKRGWYLTLATGGERVNVNPQQIKSTLLVVANKPNPDPCGTGGTARLFGLDPITGGAPSFGVFDANGLDNITSADKGYNVKSFDTVLSLPTPQSKKAGSDGVTSENADSRGQTGVNLGGVDTNVKPPADCLQWMLAGGLDTSIPGFNYGACSTDKPRISWRQLK